MTTLKKAPKNASLVEVAKRASVSLGTVSRVMNGQENVNPDIRRQVLMAGRSINFIPKMRQHYLAVITDFQASALPVGYVSAMTTLITRHAVARRMGVELIDVSNLDPVYDCHIEGAVGVVFDDEILKLRSIPNLPLITVNHPLADKGIHSVYTNHFEQAQLATAHLIERGHQRIAFLAIRPDEWGATQRMLGYRHELEQAALAFDPALVRYSKDEPLYDILQRWLRNGVTAVLNFNEDLALEVIHILSNVFRLQIGKDISTITLEDLPVYQYLSPPQTVIRQPLDELARIAVDKLLELTAQPSRSQGEVLDICLHGELLERDSVASLRS